MKTMYETGKLVQVTAAMEHYNVHILGISKSRWTGSDRYRTNTGEMIEMTTNTIRETLSS